MEKNNTQTTVTTQVRIKQEVLDKIVRHLRNSNTPGHLLGIQKTPSNPKLIENIVERYFKLFNQNRGQMRNDQNRLEKLEQEMTEMKEMYGEFKTLMEEKHNG